MAGPRARRAGRASPRSQHFLRDSRLAAAIVREAGIGPDDLVVELGAGTGRLTAELARVAGHVLAVELDPRLAARLRDRWQNVGVVERDAAAIELPPGPFRVVANLPFHRTTDLLHLLLDSPETPLVRADLVLQWNVAVKRALPWPSSLNGVVWGSSYETSLARRLPREVFAPPPSVDAGLLVVRRRTQPLVPAELADEFRRYVAGGFRHGLGRVRAGRRGTATLPRHAMARDLDAHAWSRLFLDSRRAR